jgi:hypothetical protein
MGQLRDPGSRRRPFGAAFQSTSGFGDGNLVEGVRMVRNGRTMAKRLALCAKAQVMRPNLSPDAKLFSQSQAAPFLLPLTG